VRGISGGLADVVFDGAKGGVFSILLIGLVVIGAILLIVNLTARPRAKAEPQQKWEAVPDDAAQPAAAPASRSPSATKPTAKPLPPRRKA
jgi:hypothetical protein